MKIVLGVIGIICIYVSGLVNGINIATPTSIQESMCLIMIGVFLGLIGGLALGSAD